MQGQRGPKIYGWHRVNAEKWIETGQWVWVKSSNVAGISYSAHKKTLTVQFIGGGIYDYFDVPKTVAKDLFNAPSIGKFLAKRIKGVYQYLRVW